MIKIRYIILAFILGIYFEDLKAEIDNNKNDSKFIIRINLENKHKAMKLFSFLKRKGYNPELIQRVYLKEVKEEIF